MLFSKLSKAVGKLFQRMTKNAVIDFPRVLDKMVDLTWLFAWDPIFGSAGTPDLKQ